MTVQPTFTALGIRKPLYRMPETVSINRYISLDRKQKKQDIFFDFIICTHALYCLANVAISL